MTMNVNTSVLVLDEIRYKIQELQHTIFNPIAVHMTEKLINDICRDKVVLVDDKPVPKLATFNTIYGIPVKLKPPTMLPDEKQYSIEVI